MKKMYLFLTALLFWAFPGFTTAQTDDVVTFEVSASTGFWTDWNNNVNNSWAKKWESTQEDPHITIRQAKNANNMRFWDGTHIMFFNSVGGRTDSEDYEITVSPGWNITGVSFDFTCGEVTGVVGNKTAGVSVSIYGDVAVENPSSEDFMHVEVSDIEESMVAFTVATLTPGTSTFANTKDFFITLSRKADFDTAMEKFRKILNSYDTHVEEEFAVGDKPGLYGEAERKAFFDLIAKSYDISEMSEGDITEEELEAAGQAIKDAYQALLDSKNMNYTLPEGTTYFRIKAGMVYTNDLPTGEKDEDGFDITDAVKVSKYMLSVRNGENFVGYWATPDGQEPIDQLQALWKITKVDEGYDVVNMYSESRFNNVAVSTAVAMTTDSENLLAFDPVYTDEYDVTYLNIHVVGQNGADGLYLHQNGHSAGKGVQNTIVGWYSTYSYNAGPAGSEWVLEPVSAEEAQAIIAAGEVAKQREIFEIDYAGLIKTANIDLAAAQAEMEAKGLITSVDQFSSPWSDSEEGLDFGALIDDNPSTYWHTDWHNGAVPVHKHYLQVDLAEPQHELLRLAVTRRPVAGNHITNVSVYGSNDPEAEDEAWTPLAKLYTPYGNNTETVRTRAFAPKDFQHFRIYFDGNTGGSGIAHMSGFQMEAVNVVEGSQYAVLAEQANRLTEVIAEQEFIPVADVTEEQGAALKAAYESFKGSYVDPTELRNLIASAESLAEGIVVGTNPGFWADNTVAESLASVVSAAKAYDEGGIYTAEQSDNYIASINAAVEAVIETANPIKVGKWYNIHFGIKEDFEKYGWDIDTNEATVTETESGDRVVTNEALWGKYLTVADYKSESYVVDEENSIAQNLVVPIDAADVRLGDNIFVDDKEDIENADMAKFRFVAVGDTAYVIQNKATGLFIRTGVTGLCTLSIHPSLFNVKGIGYGQNLISATDLKGVSNNNLHVQRLYNVLVTWSENAPGSRSGLYIEEVEDVAEDYAGNEFYMNVKMGQIYTYCYPVDLSLGKDNEGQMYTVNKVEGTKVTLSPIDHAHAGRPFIYIDGEAEDYIAEDEAEPVAFAHGYSFVADPETQDALKGTFTNLTPGQGFIIVDSSKPYAFTVSRPMMENSSVLAYGAYIASDEQLSISDAISIEIDLDAADGIQAALTNVSRSGAVYAIDGRLVAKKGNLNTLRTLGRGAYILNGTKVVVK